MILFEKVTGKGTNHTPEHAMLEKLERTNPHRIPHRQVSLSLFLRRLFITMRKPIKKLIKRMAFH